MGAWRRKLIFLLVIYFTGFASAIYCLSPAPDAKACQPSKKGFAYSALKSDSFAKTFNITMHKCYYYSKDATKRFSTYLKHKSSSRGKTVMAKG